MAANEFLTARLDLGNSSPVRKRVTVVVHANDFSDLAACTFWLPPHQPRLPYVLRMRATRAWGPSPLTTATLSVYGTGRAGVWRAILVAMLFAGLTELLQSLVPGRHPLMRDALIDMAGAMTGLALRSYRSMLP